MKNFSFARVAAMIASSLLVLGITPAHATTTDISSSPVVTSDAGTASALKPNVMFIVDDSGSMAWDFLPDWANDYYCKRANGSVRRSSSGGSDNDEYSVNSLCCRNRSSGNDACMYGTGYANTGDSARRGDVPFTSSDFNNTYYNPAILYSPPKNFDNTSKTSMTCAGSGGTVSGTDCTNGWQSVKLDAFGVQELASTTINLVTSYPDVQWCSDSGLTLCRKNSNYFYPNPVYKNFKGTIGNPFYYAIIPGEYCDSAKLTNCQATSDATFTYPAKLRWCSDTALTTCQAIKNATYQYPRYPTMMASNSDFGSVTTVFTVTGSATATSNKTFNITSTGITVATGPKIVSAATTPSNNVDTVTANIIANVTNGYVASAPTCTGSGTRTCTFVVMAPASGTCPSGAITPNVSNSGSQTTTITVSATPQFTACRTPGSFTRIDIIPAVNSYPKATTRTDCAGATCTYLEEMANFANWFTYYRTRMQMMKSASSEAFSGLNDNFRIGYMTLNNNNGRTLEDYYGSGNDRAPVAVAGTTGDYLNINVFDSSHKEKWYLKLASAVPSSSTPLRSALSTAGLLYGGVLNNATFNGSTVIDPMEYCCQKNFTILSTDGYWNTGNDSGCNRSGTDHDGEGCKLNRTSAVGNADGVAQRPYSDGATSTTTEVTPTVTSTVVTAARTVDDRFTRTDTTTTASINTRTNTYKRTRLTDRCTTGYTCCASGQKRKREYTGTTVRKDTTTTTSSQAYQIDSTAGYSDVTTTTVTATQTVVTTNGVITSDTTVTTTAGPTTVTSTTSGPTVVTSAVGGPSVATGLPVTTETPTPTIANISWSSPLASCVSASSNSDSLALTGSTVPVPSTTGPTTVASTPVRAVGYPITTPGASSTVVTGPTAGTTTSNTVTAGGVDDTLADVAYYYNQTDLRPANSVNSVGEDVGTGILNTGTGALTYSFQNMTTFTLGLGIDGYMQFIDNYANEDGDYKDVKTGATSTSSRCTWQASGGICNWPTPGDSSQANIDDLWHAAINGKGSYYSAKTAKELQSSLTNALGKISGVLGTAAAATTSNPNITTGDNFLFSSDFTTGEWTSTLNRLQIDPTSGNIKTTVVNGNTVPLVDWNAQTLLDARVSATSDTRTIYTYGTYDTTSNSCAGTNLSATKLKPFCWTNVGTGLGTGTGTSLTSAEQLYFTHTAIDLLPQLCGGTTSGSYELTDTSGIVTTRSCLTEDQQNRTGGKNLVNFLRGQTGFEEESGNTDKLYRDRTHVLGDIVSSEAVYVKTPLYNYSDDGFTSFKALQSAYPGMVYVAANDGMLHAIYGNRAVEGSGNPPAVSGVAIGGELWAYIPSQVLPKMYNLASMNYPNAHQFLLDGTPVIGYISSGGGTPEWKTILVGGLAAGGAGYYALDITDPLNPQGLWEFKRKTAADCVSPTAPVGQTSDCDLGYSYGNPVITKVNGTWVVLVTSGYNNISPGDGQGYLYVLNAQTGAIINKIGTGVGSTGTITGVCDTAPCPSGLGKISAWVDNGNVDNTALRVYGGDLFGNLWRFDVNGDIGATGTDAQLLAVLKGPTGTLQPITQQPGLGETEDGIALVLVGTGKLLGDSDLNDPTQTDANLQSFYAIKDSLTATGWGNVRSAGLIQQTVAVDTSSDSRKITSPADVDLSSVPGWFIDFPASGERSYTDSALVLGTVVFTTNLPSETPCGAKGKSYIYFLDYRSGAPIRGETVGYPLGDALATRPVIVQLQGGAVRSITRLSDTTTDVRDVPIGNAGSPQRRISWRLLLEN